jgi:radical SAM-linked protein
VTEAYLRSERAQAYRAAGTPDCRDGGCLGCGVCDFETIEPRLALQTQVEGTASDAGTGSGFDPNHTPAAGFEPVTPPEPGASEASTPTETIVLRARVRYTKEGEARWLSHLETVDVFRRAVRRAGLTFRTSQGFHPQPRISFLHPLPVGVAGLDEWMDMELVAPPEASEAFGRLKAALPKGFGLLGLSLEPLSAPRQRIAAARYRVDLAEGRLDETLLVQVLARPEIPVLKKGKKGVRRLDLKLLLGPVSFLTSRSAELTLSMSDEGGLRPLAALAALQDENPEAPPEAWAEVLVVKLETLLA